MKNKSSDGLPHPRGGWVAKKLNATKFFCGLLKWIVWWWLIFQFLFLVHRISTQIHFQIQIQILYGINDIALYRRRWRCKNICFRCNRKFFTWPDFSGNSVNHWNLTEYIFTEIYGTEMNGKNVDQGARFFTDKNIMIMVC